MCVVLFAVSFGELVFWGWWTYICGHLHVTSFLFYIYSPNLWTLFSGVGQLLNVTFSFMRARCIRWPGYVLIRVSCRCVIDVMLMGWACCTRLIWTLIAVCLASFYLLLLEFDILELQPHLIHWSLKYQGVERPNFQGISCRPRFECGIIFPTLCLISERCMGLRLQSTVGCFSELCFLQFSVAQVLAGLRKQLIKNFVSPS